MGDDGQTKVCAFNEDSFPNKEQWHVLLQPAVITFDGYPKFEQQKMEE